VSIAAVALARGLNAAMLHRWVNQAERSGRPIAIRATAPSVAIEGGEGFVPVPLPSNPAEGAIRIEVRRRGATVSVEWPASAAHECALLLRELMKVIRVDAAWFAVEPLDIRADVDKALARVVNVFGEARAHHAYLFINKRANRLKVLVHDGFGLWLCARKLYEGSFIRAGARHDRGMALSHEQRKRPGITS
jgi:transposase